jgi:hypothetical protein
MLQLKCKKQQAEPDAPVVLCTLQYAMAGLSYNEMSAERWQTPVTLPIDGTPVTRTLGDWILVNSGLFTESYW